MTIASIMSTSPLTVSPTDTVDDALTVMSEHGIRHLLVAEEGRLVGVLSDRAVLTETGGLPERARAARGPDAEAAGPTPVSDVMAPPSAVLEPADTLVSATTECVSRGLDCLPVVEDGQLVGILTDMDLLEAYTRQLDHTSESDAKVSDHMTKSVRSVEWDAPLDQVREIAARLDIRHLPVMQAGQMVGIVSDRDLRRAVGSGRPGSTPIESLMTSEVRALEASDSMTRAAFRLAQYKVGALPVVDRGELVGILSVVDVLDHGLAVLREPNS